MSLTVKFCLAFLVGLVTVFIVDPLDPSTVSTPFMLGIVLMGLSLRQDVALVATVSALYCVLTIYALIHFHHLHTLAVGYSSPHPYFWLFQRIGLFFVLCGLAIYLAFYRTDMERVLTRLRTILGKLPAPVLLSDASGVIVYANDAAAPVLHQAPSEIVGRSYFEFLLTDQTKGKSIRAYFDHFEADTNGLFDLEVSPFGDANKVSAQLICLGTGRNRVMITVLQLTEKFASQSLLS